MRFRATLLWVWLLAGAGAIAPLRAAITGGGPLGIDHLVKYDNSGIWQRKYQKSLDAATLVTVVGGSLLLGGEGRLGDTFWRATDSVAASLAAAQLLKMAFRRERPEYTSDPDKWFQHGIGHRNASFPSGEVSTIAGAVTPFIAVYGHAQPAVYALELLPLYDAIARVKTHGHWQSDVLAGWALGTGAGIWAARRHSPLILSVLPHGFEVGFIHRF